MKRILTILFCCSITLTSLCQENELWYRQPAIKWTDALPLGNGRIGAMVFGGVNEERIQFNEETLWTGEPRDYNHHGAWRYLDSIRQLLFAGKQKEAEALAEKEFMGAKSNEGKKGAWLEKMLYAKENKKYYAEKFDDSKWKQMTVPSYDGWEAVGFEGLDGSVWLRTYFDLPAAWSGKDLVLDLNRIRDHDVTYVNGQLAGAQDNLEPRKYRVYGNMLHAGRNSITVQVINYTDKGGITGYKDTTRHIGIYPLGDEAAKISLNGQWKYFIQDDSPPAVGTYQASYQPFGDLILEFDHKQKDEFDAFTYKRSLDISKAIATTSYDHHGVRFEREYFISAPNQVIGIQLSATKKSEISFKAKLSSPHKNFVIVPVGNNQLILKVQVRNGALHGEAQLQVLIGGGTIAIVNNEIVVKNADRAILLLTAATNYKNYNNVTGDPHAICAKAMASTKAITFAQLREAHIKEYQKWYSSFSIQLAPASQYGGKISPFGVTSGAPTDARLAQFATGNDPSFAALYMQYGRYLLIAASRPGTRPANLQGIWNDLLTPPWGSKYTTNINAEMNYWPAELLNLSAMHQPLFDMIKDLSETGKATAKEHYNAPGWVEHHNTDLWRGTAPINAANHGIWVTGGAWLCQHLWEHYLFTQDKTFLEKWYPVMKEAALFFDHFLVKDPVTGWLISTPSNSPEQGGLVAGPTMDHQIIRTLFANVIAASAILNTDEQLRKRLDEKRKQIAPNQIGRYAQLQEWMKDVDDTTNKHRHISHLWGMYPGNEINWEQTPELMKSARQSLLYRGDAATGWSLGWKINCWARFKDGEHAYNMVKMLLSPVKGGAGSYLNLFDAHPPFQIDGNFGGAAGIAEMFIQSHTQYIDILPALPTAIANGRIKGICARGGFVIDMAWLDGKLTNLVVRSKAGMPLTIRYNGTIWSAPATNKNEELYFDGQLKKVKKSY